MQGPPSKDAQDRERNRDFFSRFNEKAGRGYVSSSIFCVKQQERSSSS